MISLSLLLASPLALAPQEPLDWTYAQVLERMEVRTWMARSLAEGETSLHFVGDGEATAATSASEVELFSVDGPGILGKLTMIRPSGELRFYFDGASEPGLAMGAREFFSAAGPFEFPLTSWSGDRGDCRAPLSFAQSLRVTTTQASPAFEAGVYKLPELLRIPSATAELLAEHRSALRALASNIEGQVDPPRWGNSMGVGVCSNATPYRYRIRGNGVVHWFHISFISRDPILPEEMEEYMRIVRFEISEGVDTKDGASTPLVSVPFGDFFGSAPGAPTWQSEVLSSNETSHNFICRFPIPYKDGFNLHMDNLRKLDKPVRLKMLIGFEPMREAPPMRFRAGYFQQDGIDAGSTSVVRLGKLDGPGRLVGLAMTGLYDGKEAWDSGPLRLMIDGREHPIRGLEMTRAFDRATRRDGPASFGYTSRNRMWGQDPIVFRDSAELAVQLGAEEPGATLDLSGVAYWYGPRDAEPSFARVVDPEPLVPKPVPEADFELPAIVVQGEDMRVDRISGGEVEAADATEYPGADGAGALLWKPSATGQFAKLGFMLENGGMQSLQARFWASPGGPVLRLSLGGQTLGGRDGIDLNAEEAGWRVVDLGSLDLSPREHLLLLGVDSLGENGAVVLDFLSLKPEL